MERKSRYFREKLQKKKKKETEKRHCSSPFKSKGKGRRINVAKHPSWTHEAQDLPLPVIFECTYYFPLFSRPVSGKIRQKTERTMAMETLDNGSRDAQMLWT